MAFTTPGPTTSDYFGVVVLVTLTAATSLGAGPWGATLVARYVVRSFPGSASPSNALRFRPGDYATVWILEP